MHDLSSSPPTVKVSRVNFVNNPKSAMSTVQPVYSDLDDSLMREMQREKERLQRYFQSKERSKQQLEEIERKGKELLLKKQAKLAKIEEAFKREGKELRNKAIEKEHIREMKRKQVEERLKEVVMVGQEQYKEHLEEITKKHAEKERRMRENCEQEFKKHLEHIQKTQNNYIEAVRAKQQSEIITERNLEEHEKRVNLGWTRSQIRKLEMKQNAQSTL
jgi:hypothetical protein